MRGRRGGLVGIFFFVRERGKQGEGGMYASLLAPMKPPSPIESAPAMSSAKPPKTTTLVSPRYASPAVSAKGTVMPSEIPMMASEIMRGLTRRFLCFWPSRSDSDVSSLSTSLLFFSSGI